MLSTAIARPARYRRLPRRILICLVAALFGTAIFSASLAHKKTGNTDSGGSIERTPNVTRPSTRTPQKSANAKAAVTASKLFATLLPQAPSGPDLVETFAGDCTTPKTSFNFGDVVCAKISGGPPLSLYPRRFAWVDTDNNILQRIDVTSDPQTDLFTIPTVSTSTDYRGVWRVNDITNRSSIRTSAFFDVSNPAQPAADLLIYNGNDTVGSITAGSNVEFILWLTNNGPDPGANTTVTNATPANTTFLSGAVSDPSWNCTFPAAGSGSTDPGAVCMKNPLAPGASARITLVYNVNLGTPAGTTITDVAHIGSDTPDPHDDSNTPPPSDPTQDPSNNTATSRVSIVGGAAGSTCTLNCPVNIITSATTTEGSVRGAHVNFSDAVATGSCGTITSTPASGSFFPVGDTVVSVSSSEGDGSCSFTITVEDNGDNPPTISCPANKEVNANSNCEASVVLGTPTTGGDNVTVVGTRSDGLPMYNCDVNGENCTRRVPDFPFPAGVTTVTWTAYSHDTPGPYANNDDEEAHRTGSASCTQTVTVNDVEPPTISAAPQTASADASCQAVIPDFTTTANVNDNCSCDSNTENCVGRVTITVTQSPAPGTIVGPGTHTITLVANDGSSNNDGAGNSTTTTTTFTVNDTTAPTVTLNGASTIQVECHTSYTELGATAADNCDSSVPVVISGSVNVNVPGDYTLTYSGTDDSGNTGSATRLVKVRDTIAPTITLNSYAPSMWPPNHKYSTFQLTQFVTGASDSCATTLGLSDVVIEKVTSDEIENGNGDGNTTNDIVIAANCKSVQLRSEREGDGNGRVYTITFKVTDASGNVGRATAKVVVPHNPGETAVDSGVHYTVNGSCP